MGEQTRLLGASDSKAATIPVTSPRERTPGDVAVVLVGDTDALSPNDAHEIAAALMSVQRMLNDRELIDRVNAQYAASWSLREVAGFEWFMDSKPLDTAPK